MARDGLIEAKRVLVQAQRQVDACEFALNEVENLTYPEALKEVHRRDKQRNLVTAQAELAAAQSALAPFTKPESKDQRAQFESVIQVHLSMSDQLHTAMINRKQEDGITTPELVRRALDQYLNSK